MFKNRQDAGAQLVKIIKENQVEFDVVMAIPRGGVVVAEAVAKIFSRPMDVIIVKKLPEYAVGAVTPDGEIIYHEKDNINTMQVDQQTIEHLAALAMRDINRRLEVFRSYRGAEMVEGKVVLLVDDGIASGFTMKAACSYLRRQAADQVIVAVPVSSYNAYRSLEEVADKILCLHIPQNFYAVSQFYQEFNQVDDNEVIEALQKLNQKPSAGPNSSAPDFD